MAKYWLIFLGFYVFGGISIVAADYAYSWYKRRRQAEAVARRLHLLKEFAQKTRVA